MKKRRELDALKMVKRKKMNGQHELLNNDSDSSEIDEFSVSSHRTNNNRGSCRQFCCGVCLPLLGFMLLVGCLVSCGWVVWMHFQLKQELELLRTQFNEEQTKGKDSPAKLSHIDSRVRVLEKTLHSMHFKDGEDFPKISQNIQDFSKKLKSMQAEHEDLKKRLSTASELTDLPNKLKTNTQTLASQGSELKSLQDAVSKLRNQIKEHKKLTDTITNLQKQTNSVGGREEHRQSGQTLSTQVSIDVAQLKHDVSYLYDNLTHANQSLSDRMLFQQIQLSQNRGQIQAMQNKTKEMQSTLGQLRLKSLGSESVKPPDWRKVIMEAVNSTILSSPRSDVRSEDVDQLKEQLLNLTLDIKSMERHHDSPAVNMTGMQQMINNTLTPYKLQVYGEIQELNSSLVKADSDIQSLQLQVDLMDEKIDNIPQYNHSEVQAKTTGVPSNFISPSQSRSKLLVPTISKTSVTTQTLLKSTPNTSISTAAHTLVANNAESKLNNVTNTSISSPNTSQQQLDTGVLSTTTRQYQIQPIKIIGVYTAEEAKREFTRWDSDGDGLVKPADLPEFTGKSAQRKEQLLQFDSDHNKQLDIHEFLQATGFEKIPPTDDEDEKGERQSHNANQPLDNGIPQPLVNGIPTHTSQVNDG